MGTVISACTSAQEASWRQNGWSADSSGQQLSIWHPADAKDLAINDAKRFLDACPKDRIGLGHAAEGAALLQQALSRLTPAPSRGYSSAGAIRPRMRTLPLTDTISGTGL